MLTKSDFEHIRDYYLEPKNEWGSSRISRVLNEAEPKSNETMLDIGCGLGTFSFHASKLGVKAIGLDRDYSALTRGIEAVKKIGAEPALRIKGDALNLPFCNESFNLIINADFIEHLNDADKSNVFREMLRVMKKDGRAVIYSPNVERIIWELRGEKIKKVFGIRKAKIPLWQEYVDKDHFGMSSSSKIIQMLKSVGFKIVHVKYYEFNVPIFSKIPGFNFLFQFLLNPIFANRFLIKVTR